MAIIRDDEGRVIYDIETGVTGEAGNKEGVTIVTSTGFKHPLYGAPPDALAQSKDLVVLCTQPAPKTILFKVKKKRWSVQ